MNALARFLRKFSILLVRTQFNRELDEEMAFHRASAEKEMVAAGCRRKTRGTRRCGK